MSTVAARTTRSGQASAATVALVVFGCAAIVLRLRVATLPTTGRWLAYGALFAAMAVGSLLIPVTAGVRRLHPALVAGVGLAAVGLAGLAAGHAIPLPSGPWTVLMVTLGAVAEEALFRRAAYGWLDRYGAVAAVVGAAVLFALIHIPLYGVVAFPVDLGAGLLFGWQRWAAGTWTVPAGTHAAANLLAVMAR